MYPHGNIQQGKVGNLVSNVSTQVVQKCQVSFVRSAKCISAGLAGMYTGDLT